MSEVRKRFSDMTLNDFFDREETNETTRNQKYCKKDGH